MTAATTTTATAPTRHRITATTGGRRPPLRRRAASTTTTTSLLWGTAALLLATTTSHFVAADVCAGAANNQVICINSSNFTICANQLSTQSQSCPSSTKCCVDGCYQATDAKCGNICSRKPDNTVLCTSTTAFTICSGQLTTPSQNCQNGLLCCNGICSNPTDAACLLSAPAYTSSAAATAVQTTTYVVASSAATFVASSSVVVAPVTTTTAPPAATTSSVYTPPSNICSTSPDNAISCLTSNTYGQCLGNSLIPNAVQTCPNNLVCCASSGVCDFSSNCPVTANQQCAGISNGGFYCKSSNTYKICTNGVFANGYDLTCGSGTVCCTATQSCVAAVNCPSNTAYVPPPTTTTVLPVSTGTATAATVTGSVTSAPASSVVPSITTSSIAPVATTNPCANTPDGHIGCLSTTTFNICLNGVFVVANPQSCVANTVCCAATNRCEWPANCGVVVSGQCSAVPDNHISCTSKSTFNICVGGVFTGAKDQSCLPGTVCCDSLNACVFPGQCPSTTAVVPTTTVSAAPVATQSLPPFTLNTTSPCQNVPDGKISCLSATTFNICQNGVFAIANPQSCPFGTVCCASSGLCDWPSNCPVVINSLCRNVLPNHIACTGSTTFNICNNGVFGSYVDQTCPTGTVCCASANACVWPGQCGPVPTGTVQTVAPNVAVPTVNPYPGTCAGIPDNQISCKSSTVFNVCTGGQFANAIDQTCPAGTVCCTVQNACVNPGTCPTVPYTVVLPPTQVAAQQPPAATATASVVPPPAGVCSNVKDGSITCLTASTFNYCQNGALVNAVAQSCAPGTVCCAQTQRCDYAANCPAYISKSCVGLPDGHISCTGATTFNFCVGGVFVSALDQSCAPGTYCCTTANTCVSTPSSCTTFVQPFAPALDAGFLPADDSSVDTSGLGFSSFAASNPCSGVADGKITCLSSTTFNICQNGALAAALPQACAAGTVCCATTGLCDWPYNCPAVYKGLCQNVADGGIACTSTSTFNYCVGGVFVNAVDQSCAPGTVCSNNACVVPGTSGAPATVPPAPTATVPATQNIVYPTLNPYSGSCAGIPDNHISCRTSSTFGICSAGQFAYGNQNCPAGTVCCTALNSCVTPGTCPAVTLPVVVPPVQSQAAAAPTATAVPAVSNSCANIPDGKISCLSSTTFNICQNGVFAQAAAQSCPAGTICCAQTNSCDWAYNCPVSYASQCNGIADGHISCTGSTTFNICNNGVFAHAVDQSCVPNTYCCTSLNQCVNQPSQCPGYVSPAPPTLPSSSSGSSGGGSSRASICSGIADWKIACTGSNTFGICSGGSLWPAADQTCVGGLVCCTALNSCIWPGQTCPSGPAIAPTATATAPAPYVTGAAATQVPFPVSTCAGIADGRIACSSANSFKVCLAGQFASLQDQYCPAGLVCCTSSNACVWPNQCPGVPSQVASGACAGIPDGHIACKNSTNFNICQGGAYVNAADQVCQTGLQCCTASNQCVWPGQCPVPTLPAVPTVASTGTAPTADSTSASLAIPLSSVSSLPIPLSSVSVPNAGSSVSADFTSAGATTTTDTGGATLTGSATAAATTTAAAKVYPESCQGVADNHIACASANTFGVCLGNNYFPTFATSIQSCPGTLQCCSALNQCIWPGQTCPSNNPSGSTGYVQGATSSPPSGTTVGSCVNVPDGNIACKTGTTFNLCLNNVFVNAADQPCQPGLVCCQATNQCVWPGQCPTSPPTNIVSASCAGIPDGHIACKSSSSFNLCSAGQFVQALDQYCQPGLQCCTSLNSCVWPGTCPGVPAPTTTSAVAASTAAPPPASTVNTVVPTTPASICAGIADGKISCLNATSFNLCLSGQAVPGVQSCQSGLFCCTALNSCVYAGQCPTPTPLAVTSTTAESVTAEATTTTVVVLPVVTTTGTAGPVPTFVPSCAGIKDGGIACKNTTSFDFCFGGAFFGRGDQNCAPGTVCCLATNQCDFDYNCPGQRPVPTGPCANVPDNHILCTGNTTFGICSSGFFAPGPSQYCPNGLVCCTSLNECVYPSTFCPLPTFAPAIAPTATVPLPVSQPTFVPGTCQGVPDDHIACTSPTQFQICKNGLFSSSTPQTCQPGLVCCALHNSCDWPYNCPSVSVISNATCQGIPDGNIACTGPNTFNFCKNYQFINAASQSCAPGTVCCANSNQCDFAYNCQYTLPQGGGALPPATVNATTICSGVSDGTQRCTGPYTFNYCTNQALRADKDQYCAPGTVCCSSTNICNYLNACPAGPAPYLGGGPSTPTTVPGGSGGSGGVAAATCAGAKDGSTVCTGPNTWNFCQSGAILNVASQNCPASTVCCSANGQCDFPQNCPSVGPVPTSVPRLGCAGVPDQSLVCTGPTTFNYCKNGAVMVGTADQSCAPGTVCCAATRTCDFASRCPSAPVPTFAPPPPQNPPPPPPAVLGSCANQPDGAPVCKTATTFNYCLKGQFGPYNDQTCAFGTVCCPSTGRCSYLADCAGGIGTAVPAAPQGTTVFVQPTAVPAVVSGNCTNQPDYGRVCNGLNSYIYCLNKAPIPNQAINPCPPGTVCCAALNSCVTSSQCLTATVPSVPAATAVVAAPQSFPTGPVSSVCQGQNVGSTVCINNSTFASCSLGAVQGTFNCASGTVCCPTINQCTWPNLCPGATGDVTKIPSTDCQNVLYGFQVCSSDAQSVLTCGGNSVLSALTCPQGQQCCSSSLTCVPTGQCAGLCSGRSDGFNCASANSFAVCKAGSSLGVIGCGPGTVCCQSKSTCGWPGQC